MVLTQRHRTAPQVERSVELEVRRHGQQRGTHGWDGSGLRRPAALQLSENRGGQCARLLEERIQQRLLPLEVAEEGTAADVARCGDVVDRGRSEAVALEHLDGGLGDATPVLTSTLCPRSFEKPGPGDAHAGLDRGRGVGTAAHDTTPLVDIASLVFFAHPAIPVPTAT